MFAMCSSVQVSLWWVFINDPYHFIRAFPRHFLNNRSLCCSAVSAESQWSHLLRCRMSSVHRQICNRKCIHSDHTQPYPGTLLMHISITNRWIHVGVFIHADCEHIWALHLIDSSNSNFWETWFPIKHVKTYWISNKADDKTQIYPSG